ncbi:MAG: hypothetical protein P4M11_10360 [Candidatus Pacebacteria bacterium]|nr:hypothetical protein [Candidatus Paceibacterota bacterium]
MLDLRGNELLVETDLDPLRALTELADVSFEGNTLSAKISYLGSIHIRR